MKFDCEILITNDEAEECILPIISRKCRICELNDRNPNVSVSCVDIIPISKQPNSTNNTEVEQAIENFAAKSQLFSGMVIRNMTNTVILHCVFMALYLLFAGNNYEFVSQCMFIDSFNYVHDYYILYNKDNIDDIVFVAEEQDSE